MKLLATLALAQLSEAAVTCTNKKPLFEAECTVADGFKVTVNDACRKELFGMVAFEASFMWGDKAVTSMADMTVDSGIGVVASFAGTCDKVKPTTSGVKDSDDAAAYGWTTKLGQCSMVSAYDATNKATTYKMYWNSQEDAAGLKIMNLGQVEFTCNLKDHQLDASAVLISDDTLVDDMSVDLDFNTAFTLKVNKLAAADAKLPAAAMVLDGTNSQLTYADAAGVADVGDYMELELAYSATDLAAYSITLETCWASDSDNALASSDGKDTFDGTKAFKLWDTFCPKYTWVGPESGQVTELNHLKETWDQKTAINKIHFSQFAFLGANQFANVHYHCWVKICPDGDKATCSVNEACVNPAKSVPSRRRRSTDDHTMVTAELSVKNIDAADCAKTSDDGKVCIEAYTAAENSGNMELPTCLALAALPFLY